jgi:cold shock CspA family protein
MTGVVIRIFPDKGYGFIRGLDGISRFFHASWVNSNLFSILKEGSEVDFIPERGDRGFKAVDVRPVIGSPV